MGCSPATVGTTVAAAVLQLLGTLCIAFVVAIVVSCDAMVDPDSQQTCAGYAVGQPCVTEDNIAICNSLLADGCAYLVVAESCPVQFGCQQTGRRQQQAHEVCGPAGACGDHAHCVSACDEEICSSVRCECEPGFEPHVEDYVTTCEPGSMGSVPTPTPVPAAVTNTQGSYAVQSSTTSSSGHVNLCSAAGPDWIVTKVLGVIGGVLLVSATPLISCQAAGCAGCGERRERPGGQVALRAWQLYALASFGFVGCGILGIGFSVKISMVVPVVMTCAFDTAFIVMCWARARDPQSCSNVEVASQVVPLVIVASAINDSNGKSHASVPPC